MRDIINCQLMNFSLNIFDTTFINFNHNHINIYQKFLHPLFEILMLIENIILKV